MLLRECFPDCPYYYEVGGMIEYAPSNVAVWIDRDNIIPNLEAAITQLADDKEKRKEMSELSLERAKEISEKRNFMKDYIEVFEYEKNWGKIRHSL